MYNENNLRALAKFLREVAKPEQFDMKNYGNPLDNPFNCFQPDQIRELHTCGTVACAIGHAPWLFPAETNESWGMYSRRVFGLSEVSQEWDWIFNSEWSVTDNTKEGAAARIDWLIENGLPSNWREQLNGEEELCYA